MPDERRAAKRSAGKTGRGAVKAGAARKATGTRSPARKSAPAPGAGGNGSAGATSTRATGRSAGPDLLEAASPFLAPVAPVGIAPQRLAELQGEFLQRLQSLMGAGKAEPAGRRFADPSWHEAGPFSWMAAMYELNSEFLTRLADSVDGDPKARERIRFTTQQWVDAMSPANFLVTNPEAQRLLHETRGESLRAGLENLAGDLARGRISQTDESAFEVGRNVATTPGHVVFENELIQIIQYTPTTSEVGARPILLVPPCINKFYIMDLQPANSLVAYTVAQGNTVFMLSWRNVKDDLAHLTWDDYLERGMFEAIRVVREISGQDQINTLGFCVGGTILATALAALAARGEHPAASLTLLTTLLDFSEPGVLGVFVDEAHAAWREQTIGRGGLMRGQELASTFSALRPNDLVWNYVVSNYLKGQSPPAFDLLYWNADSTNLPGPMFTWYFRHMYLQNELRIPGRLLSAGVPIDLGRIEVPSFVYGSREDHIVLWQGAYASTQLLGGDTRFLLGASGHIAGVINPPAAGKRNYWVNPDLPADPQAWLDGAESVPGSWWPEWSAWLASFHGGKVAAPKRPGSAAYRPIEEAPGRYVKEKAD
ncbi:MAG: class I poly(R)-hydroxyalkanoic acid synthase [Burkholderiaceae bacterium]|jgi:polyhydroxyalkanoate synthase|nr:class I poly(R)-hydroxyalkanoic acid synthase [Burkholderiaceae bacterium]MEB2319826.1 class I poly(R)-hydroxyalkanoic acid synthase [Pseudomonadota bacterium]